MTIERSSQTLDRLHGRQRSFDGVLALGQAADPVMAPVIVGSGRERCAGNGGLLPFAILLHHQQDGRHAGCRAPVVVPNHAADRAAALQAYIHTHGSTLHHDLLGLGLDMLHSFSSITKPVFCRERRERRKIAVELGHNVIGSRRNLGHLKAAVDRADGGEPCALLRLGHALCQGFRHIVYVLHVRHVDDGGGSLRLFGDQLHGGKTRRKASVAADDVAADGTRWGRGGFGRCLFLRRRG